MVTKNQSITLKGDDTYTISCFKSLSFVDVFSLCELYQPLISNDGVSLFMTLYSEGYHQHHAYTHHRLFTINNMSVHQFAQARNYLEQYGLVETLVKNEGKTNHYVYILKHPKGTQQFLQDGFYARALANTIGQENYALTLAKFDKPEFDYSGYQNITTPLNGELISKVWDSSKEASFQQVVTNKQASKYDSKVFDMDHFLKSCTDFQFPYKLRSEQVLDTIYHYASLYHIDEKTMALGLFKAIRNGKFDAQALLKYCVNQVKPTNSLDLANDSPATVLQYYKQGIALTNAEAKIITDLQKDYKFSNAIINEIIVYCINSYHQFNRFQVLKHASDLVFAKISNAKDAKKVLSNSQSYGYKGKSSYIEPIPEYIENEYKPQENEKSVDSSYLSMFKQEDAS